MNKVVILIRIWLIMSTLMIATPQVYAVCGAPDGNSLTTNDLDWIDGFGYVLCDGRGFLWKGPMNKQRLEIPERVTKNGKTYVVEELCPCVFSEYDYVNGVPTNPMIREVFLPKSIKKIDSYAFQGQKKLNSVVMPESVRKIGRSAFGKCESLESIALPGAIEMIDDDTFSWCINLKSIYIPANVKEIGESAFSGCENLVDITLPEGIRKIKKWTFNWCKSLKCIVIPSTVKRICGWAFHGCTNLERVIFMNPETMIHPEAFDDNAVIELVNWNGKIDIEQKIRGIYLDGGTYTIMDNFHAGKHFGSDLEAEKHFIREYDEKRD